MQTNDLQGEVPITLGDGRTYPIRFKARGLRLLERRLDRPVLRFVQDTKDDLTNISISFTFEAILAGLAHLEDPKINEAWLEERFDTLKFAEYAIVCVRALTMALNGPLPLRETKRASDKTPPAQGTPDNPLADSPGDPG